MIKKVRLENFKRVSIFEAELDKINVLVGTNNSGKSSVLQGIHFTILVEVARRLYHPSNRTVAQNEMLYCPTIDSSLLRHGEPYSVSSGNVSTLSLTNEVGDNCEISLRKGRGFGNIVVETTGNNAFRSIVNNPDDLYVAYTPGVSGIATSEQLVGKAVLRNAAARGDANLYLHNIIYYIKEAGNLSKLNDYVNSVFLDSTISVCFDPNKDTTINVFVTSNGKTIPLNLCGTGFLQVIQIMAYSVFFKPKLMLLDEPDEHLHPENQSLLCEAIKSISNKMDMQILLATHSRHILSSLKYDAKMIWMQHGSISRCPISTSMYEILVDLGALDSYDTILQGRYEFVILTEDSDTKYLKKLLECNGVDLSKINLISYNSCSHFDAAITLAEYLLNSAPTCKFVIHRDRDFMTDREISIISRKIKNTRIKLWVTDECDIESYFTTSHHIAKITGKTVEAVDSWINELLTNNHVEIQHSFEAKRNEIKHQLYFNNLLRNENNTEENKCPSTVSLFGNNIPTARRNVIGKYLLKKCNSDMVNFCGRRFELIGNSEALQVSSLKDVLSS